MSLSKALSEVMDDIGVNDRLVKKRREAAQLMEESATKAMPILNRNVSKIFHFGSRSEGSTTIGLHSDIDILHAYNNRNVIQSMSEMKDDAANFLMIQNEDISPGYCYLQYVGAVKALFHDSSGNILLKNRAMTYYAEECSETKQSGPAFSQAETKGFTAADEVLCYYCESSPLQATSWLQKQAESTWPSEDVKISCRNAGCFVVPVGSKASTRPDLEWRVSTCLQERYLMLFSLNITQLRCYVLMKMILKVYIKPYIEDVLTSFMCKNVLFYCIAVSSHEWHEETLLECLLKCLWMLKECVEQRNCPHFIIPDNNLLAGKMTDTERKSLLSLNILNDLLQNDTKLLVGIDIDNLDTSLRKKLNMPTHCPDISSSAEIGNWKSMEISGTLLYSIARCHSEIFKAILVQISKESLQITHQKLDELRNNLTGFHLPLLNSTLGSVMAVEKHNAISAEAKKYLEVGLDSDVLSGRLKLASVLYCTGDIEGTEKILKESREQYDISRVHTVCGCYHYDELQKEKYGFKKACDDQNEMQIKNLVAYCTRFLPCEINCVLPELRYELWRIHSGEGRRIKWVGKGDDSWMDLIVVDSLPYLYCLQYKVYGQLNRQSEQQLVLNNLSECIDSMQDELYHKETCLNLLGQCLEQENRQSEALGCYISSLKHRHSNNAAGLLMCLQVYRILEK